MDRATIWALDDRVRRGPAHAFVDPRRRSGAPNGDPGERGALDLLPAPTGACHPPPAARRTSPDEAPIDRQSLARFGTRSSAVVPAHRGQLGGGRPLGRFGSRGAPLARRVDRAAPAPRRHLRQRAGAAARRARRPREREAHPGPGRTADDRPGGGAPTHRPRAARWGESGPCGAVDRLERARGRSPRGHAGRPTRRGRSAPGAHRRAGGGDPAPVARAPSRHPAVHGPGCRAAQSLPRVRARAWPRGDIPGGRRPRNRALRRRALPLPRDAGSAQECRAGMRRPARFG